MAEVKREWMPWLAAAIGPVGFITITLFWDLCPIDPSSRFDAFLERNWLPVLLFAPILLLPLFLFTFHKYVAQKSSARLGESSARPDKDLFEAYETGKHRRYGLLFSVNGAAFALVEFFFGKDQPRIEALTVYQIAFGMMCFSAIMSFDILAFGLKMRFSRSQKSIWDGLFAWPGWVVLGALWLLISTGWLLAGSAEYRRVPPNTDCSDGPKIFFLSGH